MKTLKIALLILISMLTVNTNAQIKIITGGHVGIGGVPNPSEALELNGYIRGNSAYNGALRINTTNGYLAIGPMGTGYCHMYTDRPNFLFNQTVTSMNGDFASFASSDLIFKTGLVYGSVPEVRMTIKRYSGYVGIGTDDPQSQLDVNGDISTYGSVQIYSDSTLKRDIAPLKDCFKKLGRLNGKTYYKEARPNISLNSKQTDSAFLSTFTSSQIDTMQTRKPVQKLEESKKQLEYGLLAQEVKEVFPELVKTDSHGLLTVNYIGLIPVIIEALKQQQSSISQKDSLTAILQKLAISQEQDIINLKNQIADIQKNCCSSKTKSANANEVEPLAQGEQTILYQNIPNPFTQKTEIKYYIPATIKQASLYVFNMQGSLIKTISINDRGNGAITINSYELQAGMYLYSLTADGNEIDTKRMILTQ